MCNMCHLCNVNSFIKTVYCILLRLNPGRELGRRFSLLGPTKALGLSSLLCSLKFSVVDN